MSCSDNVKHTKSTTPNAILQKDDGHWGQKLITPLCSDRNQLWNPLISDLLSSFIFLFTFDLTFLTRRLCSAAALTPVYKESRPKVSGFQEKNCRSIYLQAHRQDYSHTDESTIIHGTSACHQMWHQRLLVTWAALAVVMFQLWYAMELLLQTTRPPAALPESLQASVLHVQTKRVSFWLSG